MRENFLHYVWRLQRFDRQDLLTTTGETIEIAEIGLHNPHAGPDFSNARLRIGGTLWAGNVEIHLQSGDWYAHGHHENAAYDSVILHVVLEEDRPALRANGERIPCLELRRRIPPGLIRTYWRLLHNEYWIPCQHLLPGLPDVMRTLWPDRLLVERLEERTTAMAERLHHNRRDWENTFYQFLARGLGLQVNGDAFDMLARSVPLKVLLRHKHSLQQIEALLFGQSGLLPAATEEEYPRLLQREYDRLRHKYKPQAMPATAWKFMRLRPANFPTVRIAQLAALLFQTGNLFSKAVAANGAAELENMFAVKLSNYWQTHYRFGAESARNEKALGRATVRLLLMNTVAPFLFLYGQERDDHRFRQRAFELLESVPPEDNQIIDQWKRLGYVPDSAYQSQALLQLKHRYCDERRCLDCALGHAILQRSPEEGGPEVRLTANEEAQVYRLMG